MDLSVCGILKEGNEMIKVNVNQMGIEINNGKGEALVKWYDKESVAYYILILRNRDDFYTEIARLLIHPRNDERVAEQKKLLKFYGFDVEFGENKLVPVEGKVRVINSIYLYWNYDEFVKKYNIEGWKRGRELPKYYKHIEFNCLGKGRLSEDGNLIYVLELDGNTWLIGEDSVEDGRIVLRR